MRRLPLFPLPVVLFPGAPMPLHVFEPRYRRMVARCIETDNRFGLIWHDVRRHGDFRLEPGGVGCVAEIERFQPLPDGRSLILCRGDGRFRVEDGIESGVPYAEALVAPYGDPDGDRTGMVPRRRRSIALMQRVLDEVVRHDGPYPPIDARSEASFQLARVIRVDAAWQQALLECRDERERLNQVDELLRAVLDSGDEP